MSHPVIRARRHMVWLRRQYNAWEEPLHKRLCAYPLGFTEHQGLVASGKATAVQRRDYRRRCRLMDHIALAATQVACSRRRRLDRRCRPRKGDRR